ncbi:MAG: hypothetical protein Ta2E_09440 [Mycoplasmoidaceae bacterium]|nr:MAG: hypothetical protein Ta2E_09440 [Mycoplasmoidaceae bacterium]
MGDPKYMLEEAITLLSISEEIEYNQDWIIATSYKDSISLFGLDSMDWWIVKIIVTLYKMKNQRGANLTYQEIADTLKEIPRLQNKTMFQLKIIVGKMKSMRIITDIEMEHMHIEDDWNFLIIDENNWKIKSKIGCSPITHWEDTGEVDLTTNFVSSVTRKLKNWIDGKTELRGLAAPLP